MIISNCFKPPRKDWESVYPASGMRQGNASQLSPLGPGVPTSLPRKAAHHLPSKRRQSLHRQKHALKDSRATGCALLQRPLGLTRLASAPAPSPRPKPGGDTWTLETQKERSLANCWGSLGEAGHGVILQLTCECRLITD